MLHEMQDEIIESGSAVGSEDSRVKIEFVEIYEDEDGDLAMARNCSNG